MHSYQHLTKYSSVIVARLSGEDFIGKSTNFIYTKIRRNRHKAMAGKKRREERK